jgi:hypothetical protein
LGELRTERLLALFGPAAPSQRGRPTWQLLAPLEPFRGSCDA